MYASFVPSSDSRASKEPFATDETSGFSSYPFIGLALKFFDPAPAIAYEPIPSSAITPPTTTTLSASLDIRTSPVA